MSPKGRACLWRRTEVRQRGGCEREAVPDVSSHFGSKTRVDSYLIHTEDLAREKMHMRGDVPPLQRSGPVDQGLPASPCGGGDVPASARGGKIRKEEPKTLVVIVGHTKTRTESVSLI